MEQHNSHNSERWICSSQTLKDGGDGIRFNLDPDGKTPAFLIRYRGKPYGFVNRCGHVPVEIDWQRGKFFDASGLYLICATHGALYAPDTGKCLGGSCAGKGLQSVAIIERSEGVYLLEGDGNG